MMDFSLTNPDRSTLDPPSQRKVRLFTACRHALEHNLGLRSGERVLIVSDRNRRDIAQAFFEAALTLTREVNQIEIPVARYNGQEPPATAAQAMLAADVILMPVTRSLSWTRARMAATEQGARIASMGGGFNADIALRTLPVDYRPIRARANRLCDLLDAASTVRITTLPGTDLRLDIRNRQAHGRKGGIYTQPGHWGNLPCGEAFIAPVEGESEGVYVVDASQAGVGKIETPIRVRVRGGQAVEISGGREAETLVGLLASVRDARAYNLAEFGIGCNHVARLSGATIEDEKVLGTCHFALGNNAFFGGSTDVGVHVDGIVTHPTIYLDDRLVMKEGSLEI